MSTIVYNQFPDIPPFVIDFIIKEKTGHLYKRLMHETDNMRVYIKNVGEFERIDVRHRIMRHKKYVKIAQKAQKKWWRKQQETKLSIIA